MRLTQDTPHDRSQRLRALPGVLSQCAPGGRRPQLFREEVGGNRVGEQILGEKVRISSDLFLIEKGKVTRPVKNMRWNENPIVAFNNIDAMTPAERVVSGEGFGGFDGFTFGLICPAARIREFTFSSASDAI